MLKTERRAEATWYEPRLRWEIKVQKDGSRKTFTSSTPGKKGKHAAELRADEWLRKRTTDIRFDAAWKDYLVQAKKNISNSGYVKYESLGRNWLEPNLKHKTLSSIRPTDWQKIIEAAAEKGRSKKTCMNIRGLITTFCTFCRRNRWEIEIPFKGDLEIPKKAKAGVRHILQPSDIKTLFRCDTYMCHNVEKLAFYIHAWRFIVVTGLRRGELAGLRAEDVEGVRILHVRRSINYLGEITDGKTENAQRFVALSDPALEILADQKKMLKKMGILSPWLFPDETGDISDTNHIQRLWQSYKRQHGIACTLHELRHTFISAVKSDMPDALLKEQVGHSSATDSIGIYGHHMEGDVEATSNIINAVFLRLLK